MAIQVFKAGAKQYEKLEFVAKMLKTLNSGAEYKVGEAYYSYPQNWKWTTILKTTGLKISPWCQIMSLAEQREILNAKDTDELISVAKKLCG